MKVVARRSWFVVWPILLWTLHSLAANGPWASIQYPGSLLTQAYGVYGSTVVGAYYDSYTTTIEHGYVYNGSTYTVLNHPLAGPFSGDGTVATGLAANGNVVGYYLDYNGLEHGFVYNGSSYSTLSHPLGVNGTLVFGVSGSNLVGYYRDASNNAHGFIYNGSSYTTLNDPFASHSANQGTFATGISSGGEVVGYYIDNSSNRHGFTYQGGIFNTIDEPVAGPPSGVPAGTVPFGISGNNIVGTYYDDQERIHGFLYDGSTWTTLDAPEGDTIARGINGNNIVGDQGSIGFLVSIPEPNTASLALLLAALALLQWSHARRNPHSFRTVSTRRKGWRPGEAATES